MTNDRNTFWGFVLLFFCFFFAGGRRGHATIEQLLLGKMWHLMQSSSTLNSVVAAAYSVARSKICQCHSSQVQTTDFFESNSCKRAKTDNGGIQK